MCMGLDISLWITKIAYVEMTKKIGFIPLSDLMVYRGHEVVWGNIPNILQAHATVRKSGLPNFMYCRIPVQT